MNELQYGRHFLREKKLPVFSPHNVRTGRPRAGVRIRVRNRLGIGFMALHPKTPVTPYCYVSTPHPICLFTCLAWAARVSTIDSVTRPVCGRKVSYIRYVHLHALHGRLGATIDSITRPVRGRRVSYIRYVYLHALHGRLGVNDR